MREKTSIDNEFNLRRRSRGIYAVGWIVVISNLVLSGGYYFILLRREQIALPKLLSYLAMAAVYPLDFFSQYLRELWLAHILWIMMMLICGFGILLLNKFARMIFIILNVLHIVVLAHIVLMQYKHLEVFLEYCFKLYFNLVAVGSYVGFLTIPEIRAQFSLSLEKIKFKLWFDRLQIKRPLPKDADGYFNLGLAYARLGRHDDAVTSIQKAIEINPENDEFFFNLGMTFVKQRKYAEAIQALKQAVRINPIHMEATYTLGLIYKKEGCEEEAIDVFKRAVHIQPRNSLVYRNLGQAYFSLHKFDLALEEFRKTVELNPKDELAHYQLGVIYHEHLDHLPAAVDAFRKCLKISPHFLLAHYHLGMVYLKMERYKDAIRSFKEIINLDYSNKDAHYQLGFVYAKLKDFESAKREQKVLRDLDRDLADTLNLLIAHNES